MAYVECDYYLNVFRGGSKPAIPVDEFNYYERQARTHVDAITFGRIKKLESITDDVKDCICSVAEICYASEAAKQIIHEAGASGPIASYSNDGQSGTFVNDSKSVATTDGLNASIRDICKKYLVGTSLMYRGGDW